MAPSQKKALIIVGALVVVLAISFFGFYAKQQIDEAKAANEQLMLQNEQLQLAGEYEQLSNEFKNYESQTQFLNNDSIILKYSEAKDKVEKLLTELKTQKITSDKRIKELQDEIKTLRSIMRHYVQIIDSLSRENAGLKAENEEIKSRNRQLSSQVTRVNQENKNLSERMTLAEKLNVTNVTLTPLKSNGKTEKRITKAKQLRVMFTIPQNNSTPVGEKIIYMRITSPEGYLLGENGTFEFEGGAVPYTERKTIEYAGEEIPDVAIYWNVNTTLNAGTYNVELFVDNYRLASRDFSFEK